MLKDDTRIQLDLYANLNVDRICYGETALKYERELNAVFVDFPETLKAGRDYTDRLPLFRHAAREQGRFGGIAFRKDPAGRHWINTACEGEGSSIWWPSKDQWRDEPERMEISVASPERSRRRLEREVRRQDGPRRRLHALGLAACITRSTPTTSR